jgi:tRNA-intron endonuclease
VGTPLPGNTLDLTLVEAAWCVEGGRLEVEADGEPLALPRLLERAARDGERTEVDYLAYRDLRERGLVVRHGGEAGSFLVWPRGQGPPQAPWFEMQVCAERADVTTDALQAWAAQRRVAAVVDEDGAVTYYQAGTAEPGGTVQAGHLPPASGLLLDDRVLVDDPVASAAYAERESFGTRVGPRLVLSLTEAESLRRRGILSVPSILSERARGHQAHFDRTLPIYLDLRRRGVVPKSGLKFGTHLRAYQGDPEREHAQWLIHCAGAGDRLAWSEIARAVRLAHGVRKEFLVAIGPQAAYVGLAWMRP